VYLPYAILYEKNWAVWLCTGISAYRFLFLRGSGVRAFFFATHKEKYINNLKNTDGIDEQDCHKPPFLLATRRRPERVAFPRD